MEEESLILEDAVFKFMNLRPVQKLTEEDLESGFVSYPTLQEEEPQQQRGAMAENENEARTTLYQRLVRALEEPEPRAAMEQAVKDFRAEDPYYVPTADIIYQGFPWVRPILDYLVSVNFTDTRTHFLEVVNGILDPLTIEEVMNGDRYSEVINAFWDNLFAESVLPKNYAMRDLFTQILRTVNLCEQAVAENPRLDTEKGFRKMALAPLILPKPVFPLPIIENVIEENHEPIDSGDPEKEAALERISRYTRTLNEVMLAFENQGYQTSFSNKTAEDRRRETFNSAEEDPSRPSPEASPQDPMYLSTDTYNGLSNLTKNVFNELKISHVYMRIDTIAERIRKNIDDKTSIVFQKSKPKEKLVLIGTTLVSTSLYCAEVLDIADNQDPCSPFYGTTIPSGSGNIKPVGMGDLLMVRQQLLKYEPGEIAHIENIMKSEYKEREHRTLHRVEETFTSETETSTETERDTQTTERYELEREVSNVIDETTSTDSSIDGGFGVTISAEYGPAKISSSYNGNTSSSFTSSTASTEAIKTASSYAKEITERAAKRVAERVREQRSRTTINEVVEINKHGFDNKNGTDHVIGMYHWIDKFYLSQVVNYGERLMFEFMIPEPAAFHIYSKATRSGEGKVFEKPTPLAENNLKNFNDITESNYAQLAAQYGVNDIEPPPSLHQWVCRAFNKDKVPNSDPYPWPVTFSSNDLEVPDGYVAKSAIVKIIKSWSGWVNVLVGDKWQSDSSQYTVLLNDETQVVPFSVISDFPNSYIINVEVLCQRTQATLEKWKIATYKAIVDAYNNLYASYQASLNAASIQAGVAILGNNPGRNREIEREELKRAALELFTGQKYEAFDAMMDNQPSQGYPQFSNSEAIVEGNYVKFFEQAFEWHNMMYLFYPYFWGRKKNWTVVRNYEDTDPLFAKFLQAGYARVVVPVRPLFANAALYYVYSGQIWNGGDAPTIDDELYLSIAQEIRESEEQDPEGEPVGTPWTLKLPTNLVMLQPDIPPVLPDYSDELLNP